MAENKSAIALYERAGFVEYGRNPKGFRSRFTGWQEVVLMRLELEGYEPAEPTFNICHVSQHETQNPDEFVTEICCPVKKK